MSVRRAADLPSTMATCLYSARPGCVDSGADAPAGSSGIARPSFARASTAEDAGHGRRAPDLEHATPRQRPAQVPHHRMVGRGLNVDRC